MMRVDAAMFAEVVLGGLRIELIERQSRFTLKDRYAGQWN